MRPPEPRDLTELARILHETGAFLAIEIECALDLVRIVLEQPCQTDYRALVADDSGRACGYILYGPIPLSQGAWDIYWIAVDPAIQGRGIGRALMGRAENDAKDSGARLICLETSSQKGYERTRRFYEQAGYAQEARIRDFYKPGDDRITCVKRLYSVTER